MQKYTRRRIRNLTILSVGALVLWALHGLAGVALRDTARLSGWLLFGMVLFLAAYNIRKKLPFLPLGSSSAWLQLHIHVGLLTAFLLGLHIGWRVPSGGFEVLLAAVYGLVFVSGIVGLALSRSLAKRLTTRSNEVIFERIPVYRNRLASEVESIVLTSLDRSESTAIAVLYAERLRPFFAEARHFWHHLLQSNRPRFDLLTEMKACNRFLNEDELTVMQALEKRVTAKDDLDYQYALQATLKYWLFVHIPSTYALVVLAVVHLLLVSSFAGGAS